MEDKTYLVTGASGFVGSALVERLTERGMRARGAVRDLREGLSGGSNIAVGNIDEATDWSEALAGVDGIIHCAARTHAMYDRAGDALERYRAVNVAGTRKLALQAVSCGVRRLVFISSVKVNGECTLPHHPFSVEDVACPQDAYGRTKWEAEQVLHEISAQANLEVVIVRVPLVYGPGVKGNFSRLLKIINSGIPIPLGAVRNSRSLIGLWNLTDFLARCASDPRAIGHTFLVSDGEDLSTPDLLRRISRYMGRKSRLVPVPVRLLQAVGRMARRSEEVDRLTGWLQIDIRQSCAAMGWNPPMTVDEGLRRTVSAYLDSRLRGS